MAYLQLADNAYSHLAQRPNEYYIFVPQGFRGAAKDSYIREDLFDNLSSHDYVVIMEELAPYQNTGLSDKASRKADRAAKKGAKADKKELQGGGARRTARAARQDQRQQAKIAKKSAGGGAGGFLDKVIGGAKDIFGKGDSSDVQAGPGGIKVDYDPDAEPTFFEKYKIPLIIGGVVVVAGGIYLVTKKKKR